LPEYNSFQLLEKVELTEARKDARPPAQIAGCDFSGLFLFVTFSLRQRKSNSFKKILNAKVCNFTSAFFYCLLILLFFRR